METSSVREEHRHFQRPNLENRRDVARRESSANLFQITRYPASAVRSFAGETKHGSNHLFERDCGVDDVGGAAEQEWLDRFQQRQRARNLFRAFAVRVGRARGEALEDHLGRRGQQDDMIEPR